MHLLVASALTGLAVALPQAPIAPRDDPSTWETNPAGNPFLEGWYADPDNEFYNGEYWVYPTTSLSYDEQTYLDAFSSPDLINWTKHPKVLSVDDFPWAVRAVWAPAPISRNGKYYLYFGANDIQSDTDVGGIGVGVADKPEGPYKDALGKPMIGQYYNGAQPIDQDVFIDDDGQAYIYYGGHSHANVAKLNEDMITLGQFDDGSTYKEITPENYVEGPQMLKRNGKYYLFWSEGGWTTSDYAVSYGMSDSPTGPFDRIARILEQDGAVATGSGHNGVIKVQGTTADEYLIVYHRHPLGATDGSDRHVCYDKLAFNDDGTVQTVKMLVQDNFADGNTIGWTPYGGDWSAATGALKVGQSDAAKILLNTNMADQTFSADVTLDDPTASDGDAGVVFRAGSPTVGTDAFEGYYAGVKATGELVLWKMQGDSGSVQIGSAGVDFVLGKTYALEVRASGADIQVSVDGAVVVSVTDGTYASGMNGVRVYKAAATFDNVNVREGA